MKKYLISAFTLLALLTATVPALAQSAVLFGDVTGSGSSFSLSTAGPGEAPLSGLEALWIDDLETQLLLPSSTLGLDAYEGSAFKQTWTVSAGSVASFDWILKTNGFDAGFVDRAFVLINGDIIPLASVAATAVSGSFSYTFAAAGQYALAVGVVDVNDVAGVSFLDINNMAVSVSAVPEPSSFALMLVGLAGMGAVARKRRAGLLNLLSK